MDRPPNVLLILADDQGWDDYSCHGNPWLETPGFERLQDESLTFENFYVASVCAPSRASLLTGRHFLRTGVSHVHGGKDFIHRDECLLPQRFRAAGYRTGMWGKWHSGKTTGYLPWERGFEEAYMAQLYKHRDSVGYWNGQWQEHQGWTSDTLTSMCIDFMQCHREEPFFAYLPHLLPHGPLAGEEEVIERYVAKGLSRELAQIYTMVEQLDRSVSRLLTFLDESGLSEDTIVLYLSDNGPACFEGCFTEEDHRKRYVNGYKGHKGNMWENGVKSPLFVRCPKRFDASRSVQRLADICDLYPTLLSLCGITPAEDQLPLDGRDLTSFLEGDESSLPAHESFIWVNPGWQPDPKRPYTHEGILGEYQPVATEAKANLPFDAQCASIRTEEWKLLRRPGKVYDSPEPLEHRVLVHLAKDPKEDCNLAQEETGRIQTLEARLESWFSEIREEPHAFHCPEFVLSPEDEHTFIALYAPIRLRGGLKNALHFLGHWKQVGDGADYRIRVEEAGRYEFFIEYRLAEGGPVTLRLCTGEASTEATLQADQKQYSLGSLHLPAGQQEISLELAETADPCPLERVMTLRVKRL